MDEEEDSCREDFVAGVHLPPPLMPTQGAQAQDGPPLPQPCSQALQHAPLLPKKCRSLSSKVVSQYSSLLSPMAVDSVLRVMDPARPKMWVGVWVGEP